MRRTKTTVMSSGQIPHTMTHHNKIYTSHEKRNENGGNIRWKRELKPSRNIPVDKGHRHYYEGF